MISATRSESSSVYGLALETSSTMGGVALGRGDDVLGTRAFSGPRKHAVELLPAMASLCKAHAVEPACVRRIYVSNGPGSFTGLRLGVTAARIFAMATGAEIVAVPTLEVIAQNALEAPEPPRHVAVMLDAKRGRVYAAAFVRHGDRYRSIHDAVEADPLSFLCDPAAWGRSDAVMGEGIACHRAAVERSGLAVLPESLDAPRPETVLRLGVTYAKAGRWTDRRSLIPTYVRPPEAEEKWARRPRPSTRKEGSR